MPSSTSGLSPRHLHRLLTLGARGNDVVRLQDALRTAGADPGSSDGIFGRRTVAAVRQLQQQRGMAVDGVAGSETRRVLGLNDADTFDRATPSRPAPAGAARPVNGSNREKLAYAMRRAGELGLRITSTTGGRHARRSFHYIARAVDVAGNRAAMRQYYREMAQLNPTELFHDPMGGIKRGRNIGPIGRHGNHVHVAF